MPELRRVGHKGADLIAPGNTTASFDAALAAGVHMIEFDILPEHHDRPADGELWLAHDYDAAAKSDPRPPMLEEGLAHLAGEAFADVELDVDLKVPGYEERVVDALREHGLLERSLISSQYLSSLERIRRIDPAIRLGWSVPKLKNDPFRSRAALLPAYAALQLYRRVLPRQAASAIRHHVADALMVQWRLVTPRLVRAVQEAGGQVYVWTVDETALIERFTRLGVDGIITNDPRLFQDDSSSQVAAL